MPHAASLPLLDSFAGLPGGARLLNHIQASDYDGGEFFTYSFAVDDISGDGLSDVIAVEELVKVTVDDEPGGIHRDYALDGWGVITAFTGTGEKLWQRKIDDGILLPVVTPLGSESGNDVLAVTYRDNVGPVEDSSLSFRALEGSTGGSCGAGLSPARPSTPEERRSLGTCRLPSICLMRFPVALQRCW